MRSAILLTVLVGCSQHTPKLDNLSCDGTTCIAGYTCDAVSDLCVLQPVIGCSTSLQVCPTTTATGSACALSGFQVPCNTAVTDCANGGCRTCQNDHKWSSCTSLAATSAGATSGSSSGSGSTGGAPPGAILTVTSGSGQSFGSGARARAFAIGQPLVGTTKDSAGQVTFGFAATVQP